MKPFKETTSSFFYKPTLTSVVGRSVTVTYFETSNLVESIVINNLGETTIMRFYNTSQLRSIALGKYVENIDSLSGAAINHYSFIMQYVDGEGTISTAHFPETFYLNGSIEYTLVPDGTDKKIAKYLKYYEYGTIEREMYFKHFSLDSLFIPIGTWKSYDKSGKLVVETQVTPDNIFELRNEIINELNH